MTEDKSEVLPQMRKTLAHNLGALLCLGEDVVLLSTEAISPNKQFAGCPLWVNRCREIQPQRSLLSVVSPIGDKLGRGRFVR